MIRADASLLLQSRGFYPVLPSSVSSFAQKKGSIAMSKKGNELQETRKDVAERWAAFLHDKYGQRHAAKSIARAFGCEIRTAKSWLSGEASPQLGAFLRAAQLFGVTAVLGVLFPDTEEYQQSKLQDDLRALRARLDDLSGQLGEIQNDTNNSASRGSDGSAGAG